MTKARAAARAAKRRKQGREPAGAGVGGSLERAVSFHRQGRLDKAEPLYRRIVRQAPRNHIALHLLGLVAFERDVLDTAERLIGEALDIVPGYPEALNNLGNVYLRSDRFAEALASYDAALALRPDFVDSLNNRGSALMFLKRLDDAIDSYDAALALRHDFVDALYNRGNALRDAGRPEEAVASYDAVLSYQPAHADALRHRADVLRTRGRPSDALDGYTAALALRADDVAALRGRAQLLLELDRAEEALAAFDRVLVLDSGDAETLCGRGNALMVLQRWAEALASYDAALSTVPDLAPALANRGEALRSLGRPEEALASLDNVLAADPRSADALNNRGNVLLDLDRVEEALASYDRALSIRPDYPEGLINRGNALKALKRPEEAIQCYGAALAIDPECGLAHWNEACCRLLTGDFERGWPKYEWRWRTELKQAWRTFDQPLWLGDGPVGGKTVLLHAEQGLGDTIQFCRFATDVAALGARVILEVQPPLRSLLQGFPGVDQVVARGDALPAFDLHCPLMSLPLALGTRLETLPAAPAYLSADGAAVDRWSARLGERKRPRIGLAWSGNPNNKYDRNRSIPLAPMSSLTRIDADFFSMQRDVRPADVAVLNNAVGLRSFGDDIDSLMDTAALMSLMDVVVSVDTALAHLAAALGRPTWIPLSWVPDWRWLLDREDSPWYPTVRLYRQAARGDWSDVLGRIAHGIASVGAVGPVQPPCSPRGRDAG